MKSKIYEVNRAKRKQVVFMAFSLALLLIALAACGGGGSGGAATTAAVETTVAAATTAAEGATAAEAATEAEATTAAQATADATEATAAATEATTAAAETTAETTTTAAAGGDQGDLALAPYEINWYMVAGASPIDMDMVMREANKLLEPINATLNMHVITWGDWGAKTNAMIAASDYYDIIFTSNWMGYSSMVSTGALIPLDDLIARYGQNILNDCGQALLDTVKVNDQVYGVPTNKDNFVGYGFVFNQAYLDKYNWDPASIKTWRDVTPWLETIKQNELNITPFSSGVGTLGYMLPLDNADVGSEAGTPLNIPLGVYFDNRDSQAHFLYDDPEVVDVCNLLHEWFEAEYIPADAVLETQTRSSTDQQNGTCFSYVVQLKPGKAGELSNPNVTYVQQLLTDYYLTSGMGSMNAISTTSRDPERAMMFLNMLFGDDATLINLLTWGIENTHYTMEPDGRVNPLANNGWNLNMQWAFGNQMIQYLSILQPADQYELISEANRTAKRMYASGFLFDSSPVSSQFAAVSNAVKPFSDPMSTGGIDPAETIPKLRQAAEAAGLADVQAELQRQLDAHIAANS